MVAFGYDDLAGDPSPAYVGRVGLQQVERDPLRALGTHARQPPELVDEVLDDAFVHRALLAAHPREATGERAERLAEVAKALGDPVPYLACAGLCALTLLAASRGATRLRTA